MLVIFIHIVLSACMLRRVFFFANVFILGILWFVFSRSTVSTRLILIERIAIAILTYSLVTVVSIEIVAAALFVCIAATKALLLSTACVLISAITILFALLFLYSSA